MRISEADLRWAVSQDLLSEEQARLLWEKLSNRHPARPKFDLANLAYYFGALIVMSAMGWFMTLGWQKFGGAGICAIATSYAIVFCLAGYYLWHEKELKIP